MTNQHWVFIDDISSIKTVYIFRNNNELLISTNGKVEKAKWEYLGNKSLLIDKKSELYLFKHGFFDENILALKIDSSDEYAIFVNENKYNGELNSTDRVFDFLRRTYLDPSTKAAIETKTGQKINSTLPSTKPLRVYKTDKGEISIEINFEGATLAPHNRVFQNNSPAKNGKYKLGFLNYIIVENGTIIKFTSF